MTDTGREEIGYVREALSRMGSLARWILGILAVLYVLSGIYSISPNEIGVLQRFGRVIDDKVQSGIHYAVPWPVDKVTKVPVRIVNSIVIDDFYSATGPDSTPRLFFDMTGLASYCISGDNNLVNVQCVVQYTITHPVKYLFRAENPKLMLRDMACNTLIHCLAAMPVDEILTRGKQAIANYLRAGLQRRLEEMDTGLSVSFVELRDIKPPDRVQRFFSDVVKARIDREKMINEAESYRNERIPSAKGEAARMLEEADAYKTEVVLKAEGEADRFKKVLGQVRRQGDDARKMIYAETLREIISRVGKEHLVVPSKRGGTPVHLRLFTPSARELSGAPPARRR